ncbi:MAG TPA: YheU family protein [Steroidobacteraceae bacterium]|nr:YheU family protein [Steroidobacteraceae bacterium]
MIPGADEPSELVEVPPEALDPATLQALVESFVLREGTDYGVREVSLAVKVSQVMQQLRRRQARIVFDPVTESVDIRVVPGTT